MPEISILITQTSNLSLPTSLIGWLGWIVFLLVIIFLNYRWKEYNQQQDNWHTRVLIMLLISVPLTTLFLPSIKFNVRIDDLLLPVFGAVPLFLAAGFLGPGYAAGTGFITGLIISIWGGTNIFLPLEFGLIGTFLGWAFYQNYRTLFFRSIRHPLISSILVLLIYPLMYMLSTLFLSQGSLAIRLTFGLNHILTFWIISGVMLLVAGLVSEFFAFFWKSNWGSQSATKPSPAERRLSARFLISVVPLSIFLIAVLIISAWSIAGRTARQMLEGRMVTTAQMTAQSIPFYLETGQNLLLQLANSLANELTPEEVTDQLAVRRREIPYFSQLIYLDSNGEPITSDPSDALISIPLSSEELERIAAASIVPFDITAVPTNSDSVAALLSFVAGVYDQNGDLQGVLIGRSDLAINPFSKPLITSIESLSALGGEGMLVDENGLILYHENPDSVMRKYSGSLHTSPIFIEELSQEDEPELVYYQPVTGRPWSVVVKVPSRFIQEQAVNFALPLLAIITILVIIAVFIFRYSLGSVTTSLEALAVQANRIAGGDLDHPLDLRGEDEVGQLRTAFEQMRRSLKSRLDEQNQLLYVSQGITAAVDIEEALDRVLMSALEIGATSARAYLLPSIIPNPGGDRSKPLRYGRGTSTEKYSYLDEQVARLTEKQQILKLNNLTRPKIFSNPDDKVPPQAILALALQQENQHFGTFWVAFDQPHKFSDEEVRFLSTLAGQAALAAEKTGLYLSSEIGRQRLASVLNSTPDPVILTDQDENLLLVNSAAMEVFGIYDEEGIGKPVFESISHEELLTLLRSEYGAEQSREIVFKNGKIFHASVSEVEVEGFGAGRVCVLRDVTSLKHLSASKSDFVSTVSHDLRSPLALIQGYTSMLQMVGELNEQQASYLSKISGETEKISHLVTNLLDLGRIEADVGLHLEKKSVDDVIERVIAASQVQADQKRISLKTNIEKTGLPVIEADQALLQQALFNLVDNALKFTEPGGEVGINLEYSEDHVVYIIKDTGVGISPADQQYLFEKFFKTTSKQGAEADGSGLGLAIANSIAEKHSGSIKVESQLGIGSTFFLQLPLRQATK